MGDALTPEQLALVEKLKADVAPIVEVRRDWRRAGLWPRCELVGTLRWRETVVASS